MWMACFHARSSSCRRTATNLPINARPTSVLASPDDPNDPVTEAGADGGEPNSAPETRSALGFVAFSFSMPPLRCRRYHHLSKTKNTASAPENNSFWQIYWAD